LPRFCIRCTQHGNIRISFFLIVAVGPLHATQKTRLTGDINGASRFALATQVTGADLVRSIWSSAGVESGGWEFRGRIDLNRCWRHDAHPNERAYMPAGSTVQQKMAIWRQKIRSGVFSESAD
jgi:hypothetical protein